ncbi:MAG TPA: sigma-70 family RNA polymerase sigma factor [Actinomycetota bacterium]|nr:sigma-70 family RNA polymerase sigma factor [Actinomycetota bacterium]
MAATDDCPRAPKDRFPDLYRDHLPRLIRLLVPVLRDRTLAEDVAQETMSRLMTRFESLDVSTPLWPWLKTVAMRLAIDHLRQSGREISYEPHDVPDEGLGGREDDHWCEEGPQIVAALRGIPKRQRQALALRYLQDLDPAEVATALNLSKGASEQLVFRARRSMSREYGTSRRSA